MPGCCGADQECCLAASLQKVSDVFRNARKSLRLESWRLTVAWLRAGLVRPQNIDEVLAARRQIDAALVVVDEVGHTSPCTSVSVQRRNALR